MPTPSKLRSEVNGVLQGFEKSGNLVDDFYELISDVANKWGNEDRSGLPTYEKWNPKTVGVSQGKLSMAAFAVACKCFAGPDYLSAFSSVNSDDGNAQENHVQTNEKMMMVQQGLGSLHPVLIQSMCYYSYRVASMLEQGITPNLTTFMLQGDQFKEEFGEADWCFYWFEQFLLHLQVANEDQRPSLSKLLDCYWKVEKLVELRWERIVGLAHRLEDGDYDQIKIKRWMNAN